MPLDSHCIEEDYNSETEPILSISTFSQGFGKLSSSSLHEIGILKIDVSSSDEATRTTTNTDQNPGSSNVEQPQCRICLEIGGEDLIAPCYCRGTQKHVHRSCLDNWRSTKEGFAFAHCTECRAMFVLKANVPSDRWWLRFKFQFLVFRDHALIFVLVQTIVALLGLLVYKFYGEELREMFGYEEHPYAFYAMAAASILLVGMLYAFFIAIICGQKINQRHCHVLAKKELTKEYIVEDREMGKETAVPTLDPRHISELRMLGLY